MSGTPRADALAKEFARSDDMNDFWDRAFELLAGLERENTKLRALAKALLAAINPQEPLYHAYGMAAVEAYNAAFAALNSTSPSDDAAETPRNGLGAVTAADTLAVGGTNSAECPCWSEVLP